jgi:hypothetical protein
MENDWNPNNMTWLDKVLPLIGVVIGGLMSPLVANQIASEGSLVITQVVTVLLAFEPR